MPARTAQAGLAAAAPAGGINLNKTRIHDLLTARPAAIHAPASIPRCGDNHGARRFAAGAGHRRRQTREVLMPPNSSRLNREYNRAPRGAASAYASRVKPRYPARNPASASRSGSVKAGWIAASAVDGAAVVIGHPGRAGTGRLGKPTVSRLAPLRYATGGRAPEHGRLPEECSIPPTTRSLPVAGSPWLVRAEQSVRYTGVSLPLPPCRGGPAFPTPGPAGRSDRWFSPCAVGQSLCRW